MEEKTMTLLSNWGCVRPPTGYFIDISAMNSTSTLLYCKFDVSFEIAASHGTKSTCNLCHLSSTHVITRPYSTGVLISP